MPARHALPLSLGLLLVAVVSSASADEWTDLLAGEDLAAWRGYQSQQTPEAWSVADGVLSLDGSGGDLVTRERFGDFELRFEWKIAPGGNSGVLYRVSEDEDYAHKTGPEYQVLDDAAHADSEARHRAGALYGLYPRSKGGPQPAGAWNTGRIVLDDGRVEHWLNGELVVEAALSSDDWRKRVDGTKFDAWDRFGKNDQGHLVLQDHGARVWYRNMKVRRLNQSVSTADADDNAKRVLFVTQSAGFKHSAVTRKPHELSHCERVLTRLGVESGAFRVDCSQDVAAEFTPELVANYDVVAFFTTGDLPIPVETREWFLNTWLAEEGHGFLGVHAAADTYHNYEPYWDMIGGTFNGHPWTANTDVVLRVHDGDHPASAPWGPAGTRVSIKDEIYQFKHWQPEKVRVLMSLDMERTNLKKPYHVPVLWVKPYGAGRAMHMSLGHREDVWDNPTYQASLIGGVKWLLGVEPGDATPNPELSAEQEEIARQAAGENP